MHIIALQCAIHIAHLVVQHIAKTIVVGSVHLYAIIVAVWGADLLAMDIAQKFVHMDAFLLAQRLVVGVQELVAEYADMTVLLFVELLAPLVVQIVVTLLAGVDVN